MSGNVYFVTGGGTGGHIYPAISVSKSLINNNDTVYYIGNPKKPEKKLTEQNNINFLGINISSMPRKIDFGIFFWCFQLLFAIIVSIYYIFKYKPKGIFATGGYVSAPMIFAAIVLKVPFMMHDSDAVPGIVTRKLSPFASCVSCTFSDAKKYIKNSNTVLTGNPIREDFFSISKQNARKILNIPDDKLVLLITGGSQGAKLINLAMVELYEYLIGQYNISIIHQTGYKNFDEVVEKLEKIYPQYKNNSLILVKPYFDNTAIVMKSADLVISRAGSLSISEICASELAPVLVPYPYAAANHQLKNTQALVNEGGAVCIEESNNLKEDLLNILEKLINDNEYRLKLSSLASAKAKPDALQNIIKLFKSICNE